MAVITDELRAGVRTIVCDILEVDPAELTRDAVFADLGADSVALIEILTAIEDGYGIAIDQTEIERMTSLDGIYLVLDEV